MNWKSIFSFSKKELRDIFISAIVLSYAFGRISSFLVALLFIGSNFILHELGHRTVARYFGAFAEYRMWLTGLFIAVVSSFFGIVFAAPGAVYISPYIKGNFAFVVHRLTRKETGLISLAGPLVNFILGYAFLSLLVLTGNAIFAYASYVSFFLGLFNLIPIPPLDGSKVLRWNWLILLAMFLLGGAGYFYLKIL